MQRSMPSPFRDSKKLGVGLQDLLKINPQIKNPDKIMVGEPIKVPSQQQAGLPFQDDEDYFQQREEEVKEMIKEYFGHRIAMVLLPGGRKKSRAEAKKIQQELLIYLIMMLMISSIFLVEVYLV